MHSFMKDISIFAAFHLHYGVINSVEFLSGDHLLWGYNFPVAFSHKIPLDFMDALHK